MTTTPATETMMTLLGTDDPELQAQRVRELLQFAGAPPLSVVVSFVPAMHGRTEQIVVTPSLPVSFEEAESLLLAGLQRLRQQEREAWKSKEHEASTQAPAPPVVGETITLHEEQSV
jgi:hypothetical protein